MIRWLYFAAVLLFWGVSTSWLLYSQVAPTWLTPRSKSHGEEFSDLHHGLPMRWTIYWDNREVGWSETRAVDIPNGSQQLHHEIELRNISMADTSRELLGHIAGALLNNWNEHIPNIDIKASSRLEFDAQSSLQKFTTDIVLQDTSTVLKVEGQVAGNQLTVRVLLPPEDVSHDWRELIRRTITFRPTDRLASDFSPSWRYSKLKVGDEWTLPIYRLFPPNNPIQMVRASVQNEELLEWNGESVMAKVILLMPHSGHSPTVSQQQQLGRMWVNQEGTVLQQEARLGQAVIRLTLQPTP
ncbi:MAG: hypothetical protein O2931_08320 [Planctomycetota bacterium]|nr:hypothetical protein [Planctomycetota bacterium]MDA1178784.1 hypothetical protein [Planctomycetota bacterium]